jgi:PIN domain nuclease of toxin-antitoxin system
VRLLVDAHSLIWWMDQDHLLSKAAYDAIADPQNELIVSHGTIWEISIKVGIRKLTLSQPFRPWIDSTLANLSATLLPISIAAADVQASLPHHHHDPFDRMLVAQAQVEAVPIVSRDAIFDQYTTQRVW